MVPETLMKWNASVNSFSLDNAMDSTVSYQCKISPFTHKANNLLPTVEYSMCPLINGLTKVFPLDVTLT